MSPGTEGKAWHRMTRSRSGKWHLAALEHGIACPQGRKPEWLARAIARAGLLRPAEVEAAILGGRVRVDGRVERRPFLILPPGARLQLDEAPVDLDPETLVLSFHKPARSVVAGSDPLGRPTVFALLDALLPVELARFTWHAVGRLDVDTTGLLLFTNDERFVGHATRPQSHLPKRYLVQVSRPPDEERLQPLRDGVTIGDAKVSPATVVIRAPCEVELTIAEGRRHQVKRMMRAVGLGVRALHRVAIGKLELDVPESTFRRLSAEEIRQKLQFAPGPRLV